VLEVELCSPVLEMTSLEVPKDLFVSTCVVVEDVYVKYELIEICHRMLRIPYC
jgi:hypothetical protein